MTNIEPIEPFKPIGEAAKRVVSRAEKGRIIEWDGKKITKAGRYSGLPIEVYHGDCTDGPGISSSGLRTIESQSPLHYWAKSYLNPDRDPEEPKDHFDFGKAAHTLMLGEAEFAKSFAVRPDAFDSWRTKASQEWRDEQRASGRGVLVPSDLAGLLGAAKVIAAHPFAQDLLRGAVEHSLIWQDKETGVWLKSRPDVIPAADGILADLKTTTDASPRGVANSIATYGYAMQGALAAMGMEETMGVTMTDFVLVFVEKSAPYAINVVQVDPNWIFWARKQVRRAINRFAECVSKNEWPGYESEKTVYLPAWLEKQFQDQDQCGLLPKENAA